MAELAGMRRGSLVDEVIKQLREQITTGAWPVGGRIPPESELIDRLQVGRGTLREAVKALSHAGLLEVRQGDGTYVKTRSELSGALRRQCARSTDTHVQEVRRALEVQAARLAARRRTDEDLAVCAAALEDRDAAARRGDALGRWDQSWGRAWAEAEVRFHQSVVAAAGNPMLLELHLELTEAMSAVMLRVAADTARDPDIDLGHHRLVDAIRARDEESAAAEAMRILEADFD
jgi:DNA-binding FadR family transcriptional regulator